MSLASNIDRVAFASQYPIDKIVGVWEGTFDKSSDTTTRSGGIGSIGVYPIPHGLTRPVFTDLLWSNDGSTWLDGGATGSGQSSIAFSDDTNVYVIASSGSGTQYYKVIAFWIDGYDGSDPLVPAFYDDSKPVLFDSRVNYQKIADEGVSTYSAGTFGSAATVTVPHTLGYIPRAKAFFEPFSGEVWPINAGGNANPFLYDFAQDEAVLQIFSDRLEVDVSRFSNATRRVWHKIYFDE